MKSEETAETNTDETPVIPSFYELFALYLHEEWKGVLTLVPGPLTPFISIRKRTKLLEGDSSHAYATSHSFIGHIYDNSITLTVSALDRHFNYTKAYTETKQAADPNLFEWFSRTVKHEYYQTLREIGFLDEDGRENPEFTRLDM